MAVFHNLGREWDYSDHKMVMVPDTIEPTLSADLPAIEDSADVTVDDSAVAEDVEQDDDGGATADPDIDEEQASLPEDPAAGGDSADTPVAEPAVEADDAAVDEELESLSEDAVESEDSAAAPVAEPAAEADDATVDEELESLFEDEVESGDSAAAPVAEPAAEADDAMVDEELESLFEDEVESEDSAAAPVAEPAAEADDATVDEELESLFEDEVEVEDGAADGAKLFHQTFPLIEMEKLPMRGWVDDTGGYFTMGYLVEVHVDFIRLLKKNGRHCTVSWNRLSKLDQEYVSRVAVMVNDMQGALLAER